MIDPAGLSRVELEPVMVHAAARGDTAQVEAIRVELAARTWQGVNPYAAASVTESARGATDPGLPV